MADVNRLLEDELAQMGEQRIGLHRLLWDLEREDGRDVRRRQLTADGQLTKPLKQLCPQVEHGGAEGLGPVGLPGQVGDGRGAVRHPQ
jgi:hypothetical protein